MTSRRQIWEVARRELVERSRSRAMRVSSAILLVLVVISAVAATLSGKGTPTDDFGVVGPRAAALAPALRLAAQAEDRKAGIHRLGDRAAAERALRDGQVDVAIVAGTLVVNDDRSSPAVRAARRAVAGHEAVARLQAAGLTQREALEALAPREQRVEVLDPGARDRERNRGMLWVGVLILFGTLVVYGQAVASSVTEEKSSRVIELLLTSLAPRRLLAGKVLGVGGLGVAQLAAVCAAGLMSARIAGGEGLPPSAPETVALVIGWFVAGLRVLQRRLRRPGRARVAPGGPRSDDRTRQRAAHRRLLRCERRDPGPGRDMGADRGVPAAAVADGRPDARGARRHGRARPDRGGRGRAGRHFLLIRVAAGIYERSILRIGAPIRLRSALAGGRIQVRPRPPRTSAR